jgi:transposase
VALVGRVPTDDEVAGFLDDGWSVEDVAVWADCSARSVRNVANAAGIELPQARRRADRLAVLDDADALRAEVATGASVSAIAARLSVGIAEVRAALQAYGLAVSTSRRRAYPQLYEAGWLAKRLRARRSLQQIAAEVGCSTGAVRTAVRFLEITNRRGYAERHFPQLDNHSWLRRRYLDEGKSSAAIAAEVGCGSGCVLRALHRAGLQVRAERADLPAAPRRRVVAMPRRQRRCRHGAAGRRDRTLAHIRAPGAAQRRDRHLRARLDEVPAPEQP